MREPIKPEDIRKGDLIRWEEVESKKGSGRIDAVEYVAGHDEHRQFTDGNHYLLDRPKPAVDLPTEPTLGWVTSKYSGSALGTWERHEPTRGSLAGEVTALNREREAPLDVIRAFTPAVAVPKAALDELREWREALRETNGINAMPTPAVRRIDTFLAAVGAANGADQ